MVGIGDDGLASLSPAARAVVEAGEVLVGGRRQLDLVAHGDAERLAWRRPLEATFDDLEARRGRRVVVLASGDPMCFGVGETLARRFAPAEMRVLPAPSAFSLVCARLGWSRVEVECLSVHGRSPDVLRRYLAPGARLIVLEPRRRHAGPGRRAALRGRATGRAGCGPSSISAAAPSARIEGTAEAWPRASCAALNTVAIACVPGAAARGMARRSWAAGRGLRERRHADPAGRARRDARTAFAAARAAAVGCRRRQRRRGDRVAACAAARPRGRDRARARALRAHRSATRAAWACPSWSVARGQRARRAGRPAGAGCDLHGRRPQRARPDRAVLAGAADRAGGWSRTRSRSRASRRCSPGGRRVGGELVRLMVARAEPVGRFEGWRAAMPVTQLAATRP